MSSERIREWIKSVPFATVILLLLNISIHICVFLLSTDIGKLAISPVKVIYDLQVYRLVSAAFIHGGALHIMMNMMSLLQLGGSLEAQFGTIQFIFLTMWAVLLTNVLYVSISWVAAYALSDQSWMIRPAVGYSGVLFAYALIECYHATATSRSLFGIINVPARLYPWMLLVVIQCRVYRGIIALYAVTFILIGVAYRHMWQVVMPNISFLGHLSGIFVGLMAASGVMDYILPSYEMYRDIEQSPVCAFPYSCSNFVLSVDRGFATSDSSGRGAFRVLSDTIVWGLTQVWYIISTVLYIVGCPVEPAISYLSNLWTSAGRHMSHGIASVRQSLSGGDTATRGVYAAVDTRQPSPGSRDVELGSRGIEL